MKIVASLVILGLCANVCFATAPTFSSQSGSLSSSLLNSSATKVLSASNATDAGVWNTYFSATAGMSAVPDSDVFFGPGSTNGTSYIYGIVTASSKLGTIYKRTLNNTIVGWGNDTTMASVAATDITITSTTPVAGSFMTAVSPGMLAVLSYGSDGTNNQVYVNLVSGSSATQYKVTTVADVTTPACTGTSSTTLTSTAVNIGNIWYDMGTTAFFFTYTKQVTSTPCTAGNAGMSTYAQTVGLGGIFANGTAYWTYPGLSLTPNVANTNVNAIDNLMGGCDNSLNASNIWVVYKDGTADKIYVAKTSIATTTTAGGSFSQLVADDATANAAKTYTPLAVWASNFTYGIAVGVMNQTAASTYNYPIQNYLNGTTTATDSGLSYTSVTTASGGAIGYEGWMLSTGYTAVAGWMTATTGAYSYQLGTFYGNGTVNTTATTLASSLQGNIGFYEDLNGTLWVGWTDIDANSNIYAAYLAKLQGQVNVPSTGASILSAFSAFFALFLAALFAF